MLAGLAGCGGQASSADKTATVRASANTGQTAFDRRIQAQIEQSRANPSDAGGFARLAMLLFQRATIGGTGPGGTYTADGLADLRLASQVWERHLTLAPDHPNARAAKVMVTAYDTTGLNQLPKAVRAMQIVAAAQKPPSALKYTKLAELAYRAGDQRVADRAAGRAVRLAPAADRAALRAVLRSLKKQARSAPGG
jgi:hypothetical protein